MVRSGCVKRRRFAASPTMMLPSASRLTTEGHSVEPYGPGIHFGSFVCGSIYATRLLVVPKSIPTIRVMVKTAGLRSKRPALQELLLNVVDQVADIRAAI